MVDYKSDSKDIRSFLKELAEYEWVRDSPRNWWPEYVFHYTDIQNAARILEDGCLNSRQYLEDNDRLVLSSGSTTILAGTPDYVKKHVRLYFRPQTPTQFHAEGVRSKKVLDDSLPPYRDAHCPVPIFFLLDSSEVLTLRACSFSDGNLGSPKSSIFKTANELRDLDWQSIYHIGWLSSSTSERSKTIRRRNAEVIVQDKLDLRSLRKIHCRSEAEKETLLFLLSSSLREQYKDYILAGGMRNLFFKRHTYLEAVALAPGSVKTSFSTETNSPGPFQLTLELVTPIRSYRLQQKRFVIDTPYKYIWKLPSKYEYYSVKIYLDDHLIYANEYEEPEILF